MKRLFGLARVVWYVLSLRCEQADRIRSNYGDPAVTRADRVAERLHSSICASCRNARRQMRRIQESLDTLAEGDLPAPEPMPADARARLAERLGRGD